MFRWIINIFIAIAVTILVMILLQVLFVGPISLEVPIAIVLFAVAVGVLAWVTGLTRLNGVKRRQQSALILAYVEQSVRLNLPLSRMLLAAQLTERGSLSRKIDQLRDLLSKGISITDSLRIAVPGTSVRTLGLLQAAERVGRIGSELNRQVRDQQKPPDRNLSEQSLIRSYPIFMIVALVVVVSMLMTFVMPRYRHILIDFKVPIPAITQVLINLVNTIFQSGWVQLAILLTVAVAIIQQVRISVGQYRPMLWFTTNRQYADVCHVIADALDAGEPLDSAIHAASHLWIGRLLQRKLRRWADGIERGIPAPEAATNAGLPKLLVGLTGTAQVGATAEAFRFLSRYYAARFSRLMLLLRAAVIPAMVIFFGLFVALVALAMFLPLIAMIGRVSYQGGQL